MARRLVATSVVVASLVNALLACSGTPPEPGETGGLSSGGGLSAGGGVAAGGGGAAGSGGQAAGGVASGGTSGSSGAGGTPDGGSFAVTEERIGFSCGNSICHGGTEMLCLAKDVDRTGGEGSFCVPGTTLYETLLETKVGPCGGLPLVDPGKPETSAILLLMTRQCEELVMPADCPPEDQGYPNCWPDYAIAELAAWIASGAPSP